MTSIRGHMIRFWLPALTLFAVTCQTPGQSTDRVPVPVTEGWLLVDGHLLFSSKEIRLQLIPTALIDGAWLQAGECRETLSRQAFRCPLPDKGELLVVTDPTHPGQFTVKFTAARLLTLEAIGVLGETLLEGDRAMLSNGFQSWSNSGWIKLPPMPDAAMIAKALTDPNGDEARDGSVVSNEYAALSNRRQNLFIGATSAEVMRPWVQFGAGEGAKVSLKVISGFAGEKVTVAPHATFSGESWMIAAGSDLAVMMKEYAGRLKSFGRPGEVIAPGVGWNSWYNQWWDAEESGVRPHIALIKDLVGRKFGDQGLSPPPITLLIDDGWEKMWGEWTIGKRFPSGIKKLAVDMKKAGIEPGIWIAPFLVKMQSGLIKSKPHWFIRNHIFKHPSGNYRVLDVTHPEVAAHLTKTMQSLVQAGYKIIKVDFLMTEAVEGGRHQQVTGLQAYHIGLGIIRKAVGEEIYLLGCGAPALASLPYVNSWRIGADIAMGDPARKIGPSWIDVATQMRNISARWFLCNVTHCDADPLLMRSPHTQQSALAAAWVVAVAGGGLYFSDDLRILPEERKAWPLPADLLKSAMGGKAATPEPVVPQLLPERLPDATFAKRSSFANDIFPNSTWRLSDGRLLMINFADAPVAFAGVTVAGHTSYLQK